VTSTFAFSADSRSALAIASATSSGPPLVGVGSRASPTTLPFASMIAPWILVPPRSMPPRRTRRLVDLRLLVDLRRAVRRLAAAGFDLVRVAAMRRV
jgi:hypothetical protein